MCMNLTHSFADAESKRNAELESFCTAAVPAIQTAIQLYNLVEDNIKYGLLYALDSSSLQSLIDNLHALKAANNCTSGLWSTKFEFKVPTNLSTSVR